MLERIFNSSVLTFFYRLHQAVSLLSFWEFRDETDLKQLENIQNMVEEKESMC